MRVGADCVIGALARKVMPFNGIFLCIMNDRSRIESGMMKNLSIPSYPQMPNAVYKKRAMGDIEGRMRSTRCIAFDP